MRGVNILPCSNESPSLSTISTMVIAPMKFFKLVPFQRRTAKYLRVSIRRRIFIVQASLPLRCSDVEVSVAIFPLKHRPGATFANNATLTWKTLRSDHNTSDPVLAESSNKA